MPSWDVHIKWAVRLGVNRDVADLVNRLIDAPDAVLINDPSELGERYRKDPEAIKQLLNIEHDWGRKGGKAQLEMLRSYCYDRFGFEGVLAAELHHMLDYIAHVWKPENLARIMINSMLFRNTGGMPLFDRLRLVKSYFKTQEYRLHVKRLSSKLSMLDDRVYREIVLELLRIKAEEWNLHRETLEFVEANLDEILADLGGRGVESDSKKDRRKHYNTKLDRWFKEEQPR